MSEPGAPATAGETPASLRKKAIEHLDLAANKYKIGHYMGEVARVHHELLTKKQDKK